MTEAHTESGTEWTEERTPAGTDNGAGADVVVEAAGAGSRRRVR